MHSIAEKSHKMLWEATKIPTIKSFVEVARSIRTFVVNNLANLLSIETGDMLLLTNSKNAYFIKTNKIIIAEF